MREVNGKTVPMHDHGHKRRRDYLIRDQEVIKAVQSRILRRVNPEMMKVHCFKATRMERYNRRLLRGRGCRTLPGPPRQRHEGHRAPPVCDLDQPQRRFRGRRTELSGIRAEALQGALPAAR